MKDYRVYRLNAAELTEYYILAFFLCFAMGMLFYDNAMISAFLCFAAPLFQGKFAEYKLNKRKRNMLEQFKDVLYSISSSVAAGHQMPAALEDAASQAEMFWGFEADMTKELNYIVNVYKNAHGRIDILLTDFADRSGIEEIKLFASSYRICRKSGGNLEMVCLRSAGSLIERIDYRNEVDGILSEKKLDSVILLIITPAILFFLNMTSYDYIALLYEGLEGRIIMTFAFALMIIAAFWSLKITNLDL